MRDVSSPTALTGQASRQGHAAGDDQSDFLATDARERAMSDRCITETMPVELLRDAPDIYGIGITEPLDLEALAGLAALTPKKLISPRHQPLTTARVSRKTVRRSSPAESCK